MSALFGVGGGIVIVPLLMLTGGWELRSATRLARLSYDEGRSGDASALLQPVYDRFTDGFDTADLKAAKALLDALN